MDVKQAAGAYNAIAGIMQPSSPATSMSQTASVEPSFSELVSKSLGNAVDEAHKAEKVSTLALMGKSDITDLVTAVNSAELALNTVVAIRDKMIAAYQQISQMAI